MLVNFIIAPMILIIALIQVQFVSTFVILLSAHFRFVLFLFHKIDFIPLNREHTHFDLIAKSLTIFFFYSHLNGLYLFFSCALKM